MRIVYKGRVFSVEVGDQMFPDGSTHRVEVVRHSPSVVLIPVEDDGRVVLIRQYRAPLAREMWEFPAGRVDDGESPDDAARRECEEEIGRVPSSLQRVAALYPAPGFCDEQLIFYRVSGLHAPPADSTHRPDEDEMIRPQTVTLDEARAMLARGEIIDLKTAYALSWL